MWYDVDATLTSVREPVGRAEVEEFFRQEVAALARRQVEEAEDAR